MHRLRASQAKLNLLDGEEILYEIHHHWLAGVTTLVIPVAIMLITVGLFIYAAVGGGFTVAYDRPKLELDLAGWLFLALTAFIGALAVLLAIVEREGYHSRRWGLVAMGLVVLVVVIFRALGGQIFVIDPAQAQPFQPVNLLILMMALVAAIVVTYLLVDLINDRLIVTTVRVIYFNGAILIPRLLEKQVQQDIMLEDVQNVTASTDTYLQHWLKYGNIYVQAANAGPPIKFPAANAASVMQQQIFAARKRKLQQQTDHNFRALIDAKVYDDKAEKPGYGYSYPITRIPVFDRWLLDDNPKVDSAANTITWYPHWIFLLRALLWPVVVLAVFVLPLLVAASLELMASGVLVLLGLLALAGCLLWAAYRVEDYRNDRYMLTATAIVDIEKKPFGPEDRRTAELSSIQTVNYKTTFLSNLFGYGDVEAQTAGKGGVFTFHRVPRPRDVTATINQYISIYRKGDKDRSLDQALSVLRQYHEQQRARGELKQ